MTTVAVTGVAGYIGRALVAQLDADPTVERVVGVDLVEPDMPAGKLDFATVDVREPVRDTVLAGVDVVVHLAGRDPAGASPDQRFALTVDGTRNLLDAVDRAGVGKLVHLSSALVYGAHADNDVPLDEEAPVRAAPDFSVAYHALLAEELVRDFAAAHPDTAVAVLRPVTTLGTGADTFVARHFQAPRLPLVDGYDPVVQFLDVDDLAAALRVAALGDLTGVANVAADGWLTAREVCALVGRRPLRVHEVTAFAAAQRLSRAGVFKVEPGALCYLMYPWVVDTARLHAAGWSPTRTNREVLREFAAEHHGLLALGPVVVRRRDLGLGAAGVACAAAAGFVRLRGRRRRHPPHPRLASGVSGRRRP